MDIPGNKTTSLGKRIKDGPHIVNADGQYLYCNYWEPKGTPTSLVCVLHGYGEYGYRYNELAGYLIGIGAYVFSHDYVGHGESEGDPWYLSDYNVLIRDALQHVVAVKDRFPNLPTFLFGHSLGGSVAILAAQSKPELFTGLVVSAGNIIPHKDTLTRFMNILLNVALRIYPRLKGPIVDNSRLTRDANEAAASKTDPLFVQHGIMAQTAKTCVDVAEQTRSVLSDLECPFLITHGDGDVICDVEGAKMMYEEAKSEDKSVKIYPEMRHDLEHELREDRIIHFRNIIEWIKQRIH